MADCKRCDWYRGGTCTNKDEQSHFEYTYNHPESDNCDGYK